MLLTFTLKNGIKVAAYQLRNLRSFHLRCFCKGGALVERKEENGVAHFLEHMLVEGIPSLPNALVLSEYVESLAGSYNAYTDRLTISFSITLPAIYVEEALRIGSEVFFSPLLPEESLEKERRAIITEIKQLMDSPSYQLDQFWRQNRYKQHHPLLLSVSGRIEVIENLTREQLIHFWQKYFVPKNTYLVIAGNFSPDKLLKLLEKYFGQVNNDQEFPGYPSMSNQDMSDWGIFLRPDPLLNTAYLDFSFPSLDIYSDVKKKLMQNLLLVILATLKNSRLFKLLRYQKGLVYDVNAGASYLPGVGHITIFSECFAEKVTEVVELITKTLANYLMHGPTEQEVKFAKNFQLNQWLMAFDHPAAIATWLERILWEDQVRLPDELAELIRDIKVEDLFKLMQQNWDLQKLNLTIQGKISEDLETLKKILEEKLRPLKFN